MTPKRPQSPRSRKLPGLIWLLAGLAFVISAVVIACSAGTSDVSFFVALGVLITGCFAAILGLKMLDRANREQDRWRRL